MLTGITFWTDDKIWHGILSDLGATPVGQDSADLVFDPKKHKGPLSPLELKSKIMSDIDQARPADGRRLSLAQTKIIALLSRAGAKGVGAETLRTAIGYSASANTRALDAAIYKLRKIFGADFIKTEGGKYTLNEL